MLTPRVGRQQTFRAPNTSSMTLTEAASLFELTEDVDLRSAKRAYLKRAKKFSPERDPAGFQKTREAWEMVESALRGGWFSLAFQQAGSDADCDPNCEEDSGECPEKGESPSDPLAPYWQRMYQAEDPQESLQIALEARRDFPDLPASYWLLVEAHDELEDEDAAIAVLREAMEGGNTEFLEALTQRKAGEVPKDAFDGYRDGVWASRNCSALLELAAQQFERSENDDGFKSIREMLRVQREEPGTAEPGSWVCMSSAFAAVAADRIKATPILAAMNAWLLSRGGAVYFSPNEAVVWAMLQEWTQVAEDLPDDIADAMFQAMRQWAPQQADSELEQYAKDLPHASRIASSVLRARAPTLHSVYGSILFVMETKELKSTFPMWSLTIALYLVVKVFMGMGDCSNMAEDSVESGRSGHNSAEMQKHE